MAPDDVVHEHVDASDRHVEVIDDDSAREPEADGRVRLVLVVVAATGVLLASLAPSVTFGVHLLGEPLNFERWTLLYPLTAIGLVGVALAWASLSRRPVRSWPWAIWPLALLLAWSLMSVGWSVSPDATAMRALTAVGIAAFGVWFGLELRFDEQLSALALFSAVATVGSYVLIVWWPNLSRNDFGGYGWQGVFVGPNSLGPAAVIGILTAVGVAVRYRRPWVVALSLVMLLANAVLLRESLSTTAQVAVAVGLSAAVVVGLVVALRARGARGSVVGTTLGVVGVGAVAAVVGNVSSIASWLGQDPTLTGRTLIWEDVRDAIADRPLQGYGYWGFWDNLDVAGPTYERLGLSYGSAHNSFLEMALGLGVPGAILFGLVVVAAVVAVSTRVWRQADLAGVWWAVLLASLLAEHLLESFVLWHSYLWILLISAAFVPSSNETAAPRRHTEE